MRDARCMKIVVIGGSGLIGSKLVDQLRQDGHHLLAPSPESGVDIITGEGLAEAMHGTQVVVDAMTARAREDEALLEFFQRRLAICSPRKQPPAWRTT